MMLSITNTPFLQKVHFLTIQVLFLCCAVAAAAEAVAAGQSKIEISIFEMKGAWVKKEKSLTFKNIQKKEKNVSKVTKKFQKRS